MTHVFSNHSDVLPEGLLAEEILAEGQFFDAGGAAPQVVGQAFSWADFVGDNALGGVRHQIYNFEVEGTHTYIAGGIRVHNVSNSLLATSFFDDPNVDFVDYDPVNDIIYGVYNDGSGRVVEEKLWSVDDTAGTYEIERKIYLDSNNGAVIVQREVASGGFATDDRQAHDTYLYDVETAYGNLGEGLGGILAPFLAASILPDDNVFVELVGTTVLDATLSNLGEAVGDFLNGALDGNTSVDGVSATDAAISAFNDFTTDLTIAGISQISSLITSQIFGALDLDPVAEAALSAVANAGINSVLQEGAAWLSGELGLGLNIQPVDFTSVGINLIPAVISAVIGSSIEFESEAGYIAYNAANTAVSVATLAYSVYTGAQAAALAAEAVSTVASLHAASTAVSGSAAAASGAALAVAPYTIVAAFVVAIIATVVDNLADVNPTAQAITNYNSDTRLFETLYIYEGDGGNIDLAEALGDNYTAVVNQTVSTLNAEITSDHQRSLGHWKGNLVTEFDHWATGIVGEANIGSGEGQTNVTHILAYPFDSQSLVIYAVLSEIYDLQLQHGDAIAVHVLEQSREHFDQELNTYFVKHFIEGMIDEAHNSALQEGGSQTTEEYLESIANDPARSDALRQLIEIQGHGFGDFFELQTFSGQEQNYTSWVMTVTYEDFAATMFPTTGSLYSVFQGLTNNLQISADYRSMLQNGEEISAIIDLNPDSAFAASWALTLLQATELGLTDINIDEAERFYGTGLANTINALGGDDYIDGGLGDDLLFGGTGNDTIIGGGTAWEPDTTTELAAVSGATSAIELLQTTLDSQPDHSEWSAFLTGDQQISIGDSDVNKPWGVVLNELAFGTPSDQDQNGTPPNQAFLNILQSYGRSADELITWTLQQTGDNSVWVPVANYTPAEMLEWHPIPQAAVLATALDSYVAHSELIAEHLTDQAQHAILSTLAAGVVSVADLRDLQTAVTGLSSQLASFEYLGDRDYLSGGEGADTIIGGAGADTLSAGGNETSAWELLDGGTGQDVYEISSNSRNVLIVADASGNADTVRFLGVNLADVTFGRHDYATSSNPEIGIALSISWADEAENRLVRIADLGSDIERFEFADGSVITSAAIPSHWDATANEFSVNGTAEDDIIHAGGNVRQIFSGAGNDDLGRAHFLYGQDGDDTYRVGRDGVEGLIHYETSGTDKVIFEDLALSEVSFRIAPLGGWASLGEQLVIEWTRDDGELDSLAISNRGADIERFEFADGSVITSAAIPSHWDATANEFSVNGTAEDDIIHAGGNVRQIFSGAGNDDLGGAHFLYGQDGDDTYRVGRDGVEGLIHYETSGTDKVIFEDLALSEVSFRIAPLGGWASLGEQLVIEWTRDDGELDSLAISNRGADIERFEFADGSVITSAAIPSHWDATANEFSVNGTAEDDIIHAGGNVRQIFSGAGNDDLGRAHFLYGQDGDDTYRVGRDGVEGLIHYETSGTDKVIFEDLALSEVSFRIAPLGGWASLGEQLVIEWTRDDGELDSLAISNRGADIERFEFADGSVITSAAIPSHWDATANEFSVNGTAEDDIIHAGGNVRQIFSGAGNDDLGGAHFLYGQDGDDTYRVGRDGVEGLIHYETSGTDKVIFEDLALSEVSFRIAPLGGWASLGEQLVIEWTRDDGELDSLAISNRGADIERFEFADGSVITSAAIPSHWDATANEFSVNGTAEDDIIHAGGNVRQIFSGAGNDDLGGAHFLYGQDGDDTYRVGRDGVVDVIHYETSGNDTVIFEDIALSEVDFAIKDRPDGVWLGDYMEISWIRADGVTDSLAISESSDIERFEFADGSELSKEDVLAII